MATVMETAPENQVKNQVEELERELLKCAASRLYFSNNYVRIYDSIQRDWIAFELWPEQAATLSTISRNRKTVILKARQLGMTWLTLADALWQMLFRPKAVVLLFSRRDDEAIHLLDDRLKGMYRQLPSWMQAAAVVEDNSHEFALSNGSVARAFPTSGGDTYTATYAVVDEADLIRNLDKLMTSVKPTIDAGGQLVLLSRPDKSRPGSMFKEIYRGARAGENEWACVFLPWWVQPARTEEWYEGEKADVQRNTGSLDALYEQYPSTDVEALAPASLNKRLPAAWLEECFVEQAAIEVEGAPAIPGLVVFRPPERGRRYVGGLDCAEGLPSSDDSATTFLDAESGEEVSNLVGKLTPAMHAAYSAQIATWYNGAGLMVENNNHGHAAILWLQDNGCARMVLKGHNRKAGWTSSTLGKVLLYDAMAEAARNEETTIHDFGTLTQLMAVEKSTLRAPEGELDDRADSFALAVVAMREKPKSKAARRMPVRGLWSNPGGLAKRRR